MKASRKRRFQPSEASIGEDEEDGTAAASPRKVQKAFGGLNLQLSQESQQNGRQQPRSPPATHQTQLNFQRKGSSTQPSQALLPKPPQATAAPAATQESERWSVKHAPVTEADLVVAKKKVTSIKEWLEATRDAPMGGGRPQRVLLLTGPPGSGKSALVRCLATDLGLDLCEWRPSAPASWSEHQLQPQRQQDSLHFPYQSKLGEFEEFTARAKLPALALAPSSAMAAAASSQSQPSLSQHHSQQQPLPGPQQQHAARPLNGTAPTLSQAPARPKLLVLDDLPHASDPEQRSRLADALADALAAARFPTVLMATEMTSRGGAGGREATTPEGLHPDLMRVVDAIGALHVSLNAVTAAAVRKRLLAVAAAEGVTIGVADAERIADGCNGDLRSALETLHILCCGSSMKTAVAKTSRGRRAKKPKKADAAAVLQPSATAFIGQDAGLTLFHALGKLLYNKRDAPGASTQAELSQSAEAPSTQGQQAQHARHAQQSQQLHQMEHAEHSGNGVIDLVTDDEGGEDVPNTSQAQDVVAPGHWTHRRRLQCDPEVVLQQSGLEARSVAAFLHENVLEFVAHDGIDSAADILAYLSDAERMACYWIGSSPGAAEADEYASASMLDACAGAVAARGVLFANVHQAPPRFFPMRSPALFAAQRACVQNRAALSSLLARTYTRGMAIGVTAAAVSEEILPAARRITDMLPGSAAGVYLPPRWARMYNGQVMQQEQCGATFNIVSNDPVMQRAEDDSEEADDIEPWL